MAEQQTQPETTGISESEAAERLSAIFSGSSRDEEPEVEQPSPDEVPLTGESGYAPPEDEEEPEAEAEDEPEDEEEEAEESDEDGENPEEDESGDLEDLHTVKVRGEELEVTYDELLRGYSRTEDYTRDKQALKAEAESTLGEYREARDAYAHQLQHVAEYLRTLAPPAQDWERLRVSDPAKFAEEYGRYQQFQQQFGAVRQRLETVEAERAQVQAIQEQQYIQEQQKKLLEYIPEWADREVAQREHAEIEEFMGHEYGYAPDELHAITDARVFRVIRDAMAYRKVKATESAVKAKGRKASRKLSPGGKAPTAKRRANVKAKRDAMNRLKKTGTEADAAAALKAIGL